ncbi:hypothetical protein L798_12930 [Zootermopsis nevadensis]|uniref:Uncharacterized protein n=1 Tax=Zootermopsis nevadensis TaxID=136037 RepID=A0A067R2H5_ZOONE|nr:hypothetical protein L798_12930 [Zootermopsis nevadensis]
MSGDEVFQKFLADMNCLIIQMGPLSSDDDSDKLDSGIMSVSELLSFKFLQFCQLLALVISCFGGTQEGSARFLVSAVSS